MRCNTTRLAREVLRPPVDPPVIGASLHPFPAGQGVDPRHRNRLAVASPVRSVPAPDTHDQAYAALDLHQGIGLGCEQWAFLPLCNPDQPSADWMRATVSPLDHDQGVCRLGNLHQAIRAWGVSPADAAVLCRQAGRCDIIC